MDEKLQLLMAKQKHQGLSCTGNNLAYLEGIVDDVCFGDLTEGGDIDYGGKYDRGSS